jgi:hypothetical protein
MITSNNSRQAVGNALNAPAVVVVEDSMQVANKTAASNNSAYASPLKVVTPKRYSFDDNGGGYEGL